ncbi:MAG TPA: MarR family transcriptional regulator [Thermomicrobiaceae bacterium]|nr:MarR family transcriptional regulator [Thermomicrobiaceae bacterium]
METVVDLTATRGCHCLAARREARALTRLYEEHLRPHGLRATQFSVLAALSQKGPTPVGELAEILGLERTTLTRGAALLERNGWVAGDRSQDARERLLGLTPAGLARLEAAFPAWQAAQDLAERGGSTLTPVPSPKLGRGVASKSEPG